MCIIFAIWQKCENYMNQPGSGISKLYIAILRMIKEIWTMPSTIVPVEAVAFVAGSIQRDDELSVEFQQQIAVWLRCDKLIENPNSHRKHGKLLNVSRPPPPPPPPSTARWSLGHYSVLISFQASPTAYFRRQRDEMYSPRCHQQRLGSQGNHHRVAASSDNGHWCRQDGDAAAPDDGG